MSNIGETIFIKTKRNNLVNEIKELIHYRDLLYFLISREIKVRYKQTILGALWAIIQPLLSTFVFTIFFGRLAKISSDGIPYPVFNLTAMVVWTYFSNSLTQASNSLINNSNLISKVYFPRILMIFSSITATLLDFGIAFIFLVGLMFYYNIMPGLSSIWAIYLIFLLYITVAGVGAFLSALSVKYRDIKYAVPFFVQFGMFISPVVYPMSLIPEKYRLIYAMNPLAGIIEEIRVTLLMKGDISYDLILLTSIVSTVIFIGGVNYFKKVEKYFADVI